MSNYGEILDNTIFNNDIYQIFIDYFDDPLMYKTEDKDIYSTYTAQIQCGFSTEWRYLIAFVPKDNNHSHVKLSSLRWLCLQMRTLKHNKKLPLISYKKKRSEIIKTPIYLEMVKGDEYIYKNPKINMKIILLNEKNSRYLQEGTLESAIETWRTVFVLS